MQFIKDGPNIPESLLQAHEDGRVVFFCGAGISYPAGLPSFEGLVDKIYDDIGEKQNSLEAKAYKSKQYDTALDLLERRIAGTKDTIRKALWRSLTPNLKKKNATRTHDSLLKLSCDKEGVTKLVTTNFDRVFEKIIKKNKSEVPSFVAPLLPIPKRSRWNGLVYLHGLLPEKEDSVALNRLVFTSGDFGLAYLTERWASRFVSDLFQNYVVCFVGYSINDPVLRYMMDALAADRLLGEQVPEAYAFGEYKLNDDANIKDEWEAKGVTPILYRVETPNDHSKLHDTIYIWAKTYSEGSLGKESIVAKHATYPPTMSTKEDDYVGRVIWALSDPTGIPAQRFANLNPCPPIEWLDKLSARQFSNDSLPRFGIKETVEHERDLKFSLIERPSPSTMSTWLSLRQFHSGNVRWDSIIHNIARWLTRHLNDPTVALWLSAHNGKLNDNLKLLIQDKLTKINSLSEEEIEKFKEDSPNAIPNEAMLRLWKVFLADRVASANSESDLFHWMDLTKSLGFDSCSRFRLKKILTPKIKIRKSFSLSEEPYSWELTIEEEHISHYKDDIIEYLGNDKLAEMFNDFESLLLEALYLEKMMGGTDQYSDRSHWDLPSISPHPQNRGFNHWVCLIEFLRDSWLQVRLQKPQTAQKYALSWFDKPFPTFKRLALFAARHDNVVAPQVWCEWLCQEDGWWLWSTETQRETMRLIVLQGNKLDTESQKKLENKILSGLPRHMFREDLEPERFKLINDHSIWLHLAKLRESGIRLSKEAEQIYSEYSMNNPDCKIDSKYEKDEFSHWMSGTGDPDFEDERTYELAPTDIDELIEWLKEPVQEPHFRHDDNWREFCRENISLVIRALTDLFEDGIFPAQRWNTALWAWLDESVLMESSKLAIPTIERFTLEQVYLCIHSLANWIKALSKHDVSQQETYFSLIDKLISAYKSNATHSDSDEITINSSINNPIGITTEAIFNSWFKTNLKDNDRLHGEYYRLFNKICCEPTNIFDHGKLIISSQSIAIYRVDPDWAKEYLIPLFDWRSDIRKAMIIWQGFLWSPRIYLPLIVDIKPYFLDTVKNISKLHDSEYQFIQFFMYTALDQSSILSKREVRQVLEKLPNKSLGTAAKILSQALSASEQKEEYWSKRIHMLWKNTWPKSKEFLTEEISSAFCNICIDSGDCFPAALEEMKAFLIKIQRPTYIISKILNSNVITKYPIETLDLLNTIIDPKGYPPHKLKECLRAISDANDEIKNRYQFKSLLEFSR